MSLVTSDAAEGDPSDAAVDGGFEVQDVRSRWGRIARRARWTPKEPLALVALIAIVVAVGHGVWIFDHREVGAFDAQEARAVAESLRLEREIGWSPISWVVEVIQSDVAPLIPTLSLPFTLMFRGDPRAPLLAQPLLMVVAAVAVAGITRRLAGRWSAVVAGVAFLGFPIVALAAQSYRFGLGGTAAFAVAMWALLASDRCQNRRIWIFGVAVGALLLSRPGAINLLPAVALAGLVAAGTDRRRLVRLGLSVLLGVAMALPWWIASGPGLGSSIRGASEHTGRFGSDDRGVTLWGWVFDIKHSVDSDQPWVLQMIFWALGFGLFVTIRSLVRSRRIARPITTRQRNVLVLFVAAIATVLGLIPIPLEGAWFELPALVVMVPVLVAVASRAFIPFRIAALVGVVFALGFVNARAWWWIPPGGATLGAPHFDAVFADVDPRFDRGRRDEHRDAAAEWAQLSAGIAAEMRAIVNAEDEEVEFVMSGNTSLFNAGTVRLSAELQDWTPWLEVPDTTGRAQRRDAVAVPDDHERVLILALHDEATFPPDHRFRTLVEDALDAGWEETFRVPFVAVGDVVVLRH